MARKQAGAQLYAAGPYYNDWPQCLRRYDWVVKAGFKSADAMLNVVEGLGPSICKVCGGKVERANFDAHVREHAQQLGLVEGDAKAPLHDDVETTLWERLVVEEMSQWGFDVDSRELSLRATLVIVGAVSEAEVDYRFCPTCES